jgi:Domain of unknown function (DUF6362)
MAADMPQDGPPTGSAAVPEVWTCPSCGADLTRSCAAPRAPGCRVDREMVIRRLEAAGETALAMGGRSVLPGGYRSCMPEPIRAAIEAYGYTAVEHRPAIPSAAEITRMECAYAWLGLIEEHRRVVRRIVALRSLVDPLNGRHLVPWTRLGTIVRADHRAVRRWHAQGIETIVIGLGGVPPARDFWYFSGKAGKAEN